VITAIDTNVLLDVVGADPKFAPASADALRRCLREGVLVASEMVWTGTATVFGDAQHFRDAIRKLPASFSPMMEEAAIKAAETWRRYRAGGGRRSRIAADFLNGAHALPPTVSLPAIGGFTVDVLPGCGSSIPRQSVYAIAVRHEIGKLAPCEKRPHLAY